MTNWTERLSVLDEINYCPVCGKKLIKERYRHSYSVKDGSEVYRTDVTCPNNNWLRTHYHDIYDDDGNSCIYWSID
jgi:hypothetical protein